MYDECLLTYKTIHTHTHDNIQHMQILTSDQQFSKTSSLKNHKQHFHQSHRDIKRRKIYLSSLSSTKGVKGRARPHSAASILDTVFAAIQK